MSYNNKPSVAFSNNEAPSSDDEESFESSCKSENEENTTSDSDKPINVKKHLDRPNEKSFPIGINDLENEDNGKFILIPDNYFTMRSHKQKSSNNAFSKFIDDEDDTQYDPKQQTLENHLLTYYSHKYFDKWMYILTNFNIILYGVGSKYSILQNFVNDKLINYPCIVINGLNPDFQIKHILKTVITDTLDIKCNIPNNISESIQLIHDTFEEYNLDLFFIIHNIDGAVLRKSKTQAFFAELARTKNVHIIASVDHVNASLLWDNDKMNSLNFSWWNVPTFSHYTSDIVATTQESEICHISYLNSIYKSLTKNLKEIFKVIIDFQLSNEQQYKYEGLLFDKLFTLCREKFLVSSDYTLHNYLKEFMDQKIIKVKLTKDGSEKFIVPYDSSILRQLLDKHNEL